MWYYLPSTHASVFSRSSLRHAQGHIPMCVYVYMCWSVYRVSYHTWSFQRISLAALSSSQQYWTCASLRLQTPLPSAGCRPRQMCERIRNSLSFYQHLFRIFRPMCTRAEENTVVKFASASDFWSHKRKAAALCRVREPGRVHGARWAGCAGWAWGRLGNIGVSGPAAHGRGRPAGDSFARLRVAM